jgi:hypothetical protein
VFLPELPKSQFWKVLEWIFFIFFWPFGIFYGILVCFFPFWHVAPRKIWQPSFQRIYFCDGRIESILFLAFPRYQIFARLYLFFLGFVWHRITGSVLPSKVIASSDERFSTDFSENEKSALCTFRGLSLPFEVFFFKFNLR